MNPLPQSGALAYRRTKRGRVEVLLVKKPLAQNWGIPKGKLEPDLTPWDNAAKEAFEEAGLKGKIGPVALGSYRALKRVADQKVLIEVLVYPLEVTRVAKRWPEKARRLVKWCSPLEAARLLREPLLSELCQKLARGQDLTGGRDS